MHLISCVSRLRSAPRGYGQCPRGTLLAINSEPTSRYLGAAVNDALAGGRDELAVMFELTERRLLTHPHSLLAKVAALRRDGFRYRSG